MVWQLCKYFVLDYQCKIMSTNKYDYITDESLILCSFLLHASCVSLLFKFCSFVYIHDSTVLYDVMMIISMS